MSRAARAHRDALVPGNAGSAIDSLDFTLPDALVAREPAEARGLARDEVRLLVSDPEHDGVRHATARDLPQFLRSGDVLVVNTSATINAALDAWRPAHGAAVGEMIGLHLSSPVPFTASDSRWVVELRRLTPNGAQPLLDAAAGEEIRLRGGGSATLVTPFGIARPTKVPGGGVRLWEALLACPGGVLTYAAEHGSPIRYGYVRDRWPRSAYQTIFSREPGSAEMPSAGRPFTREMVAALEAKGVIVAPLVLHTGVSSLESDEPPYPERYHIAYPTALAVNSARRLGGRVIAVGTTVVRALETAVDDDGYVRAGGGWTDLVITPERRLRAVDGMLTGLHGPGSSHLSMLQALAGREHIDRAYDALLEHRYLWHEFGDAHLILP